MPGPILVAAAFTAIQLAFPSSLVTQAPPPVTGEQAPQQPLPLPDGAVRMGAGVTSPEIIKEVKPRYTAEAMSAKIQGSVDVEAVVKTDGTVGTVRVVRSLDKEHGLDDQAVKAVKQWLFRPGRKDGVAVPVLVSIELTFTLRAKREK